MLYFESENELKFHYLEAIKKNAFVIRDISEACIGGYQISHIPLSKQASIPYKLANIPLINFPKYSISLKVTQILNTYPISLEVKWKVSYIPGSKMANILYP